MGNGATLNNKYVTERRVKLPNLLICIRISVYFENFHARITVRVAASFARQPPSASELRERFFGQTFSHGGVEGARSRASRALNECNEF